MKALYGEYKGNTNPNASVKQAVNSSLKSVTPTLLDDASYWSSTQHDDINAWYVNFKKGYVNYFDKNYHAHRVRIFSAF